MKFWNKKSPEELVGVRTLSLIHASLCIPHPKVQFTSAAYKFRLDIVILLEVFAINSILTLGRACGEKEKKRKKRAYWIITYMREINIDIRNPSISLKLKLWVILCHTWLTSRIWQFGVRRFPDVSVHTLNCLAFFFCLVIKTFQCKHSAETQTHCTDWCQFSNMIFKHERITSLAWPNI